MKLERKIFNYVSFGNGDLNEEDIKIFCEKYPRAGVCLKKWIKDEEEFPSGWFGAQGDLEYMIEEWREDENFGV